MAPKTRAKGDTLQSYLPAEEFKRVADVRRAIWTGGFCGLAVGGFGGLGAYSVARALNLFGMAGTKPRLMGMGLFMGGSALGGFTGSLRAGMIAKDELNLNQAFQHNREDPITIAAGGSRYQELRARAAAKTRAEEELAELGGAVPETSFYATRRLNGNGRYEQRSRDA